MGIEKPAFKLGDKCILGLALLGLTGACGAFAFPVEIAAAPGNDLKLTLEAIQDAQSDLYLNIYEMNSTEIGDAIIKQVNAGLHVEILAEGQPVGGVSKAEKSIQDKIIAAMTSDRNRDQSDHYYVMTSKASAHAKRRYRYDHAKYIIVDGQSVLLGSENYSETSHPKKPGNRGWETYVHGNADLVKTFQQIFQTDTDSSYGDIEDMTDDSNRAALPAPLFAIGDALAVPSAPAVGPAIDLPNNATVDVSSISTIFSPNSLSGLLDLINGARKTLKLEMMTFSPVWGSSGKESPLLEAVEAAAKRGVNVEVLLNDDTVFDNGSSPDLLSSTSKNNNEKTVSVLNQAASDDGSPLEARIANIKAMEVDYIHNKGVLVDGNLVLVSSINWNENSITRNREAGVILSSTDINAHYSALFNRDWLASN
jgi:phosphatidylserine/phosphatidylglycerophosphate/cardiolipin synthase-like enzyme